MIYDIFLPSLIIFSIFSITIILARKIPKISFERDSASETAQKGISKPHLLTVLFCFLLSSLEKILRQIRIHILKFDAKIFSMIEYLRRESAGKLKEVNKMARKNIAKAVIEGNAHKISAKIQFKMEETKLLHTIARNPQKAENYRKLGILYRQNKNFRDAEASFSEYLKLNPDDLEIRELMKKAGFKKE